MNDISDDVYKVISRNGESGSKRLRLLETEAIGWTLSVLATVAAEIETTDLLR